MSGRIVNNGGEDVNICGDFSISADELFSNPITNTSSTNPSNVQQELNLSSFAETSCLGLTLTKTRNFSNLLKIVSSESQATTENRLIVDTNQMTDHNLVSQTVTNQKLRASNFYASSLQIGSWEWSSQREGDLVGKCYYAKKKIVWEVLNGDRKSKIEIKFSTIDAIRATIRGSEPGILEIELNQPPDFYIETTPQPTKHTNWQEVQDFTGGQAVLYRRHFVECPSGALDKHYEKLLQCDNRLLELSRRPFPKDQNPLFPNINGINTVTPPHCNSCGSNVLPSLRHCFTSIPGPSPQPHGLLGWDPQISVTGFPPKDGNFCDQLLPLIHDGNTMNNMSPVEAQIQAISPSSIVAATPEFPNQVGQVHGTEAGIYHPNLGKLIPIRNSVHPLPEQLEGQNQEIATNHLEHIGEKLSDFNLFSITTELPGIESCSFYPQSSTQFPPKVCNGNQVMPFSGGNSWNQSYTPCLKEMPDNNG